MRLFAIAILPLALLAGCGTSATVSQHDRTVANVTASMASLTATGKVILACYSVPRCNAVAPKPQIKAAYGTAYDAVIKAQSVADAGGTPDMTATASAMTALQGIIAQLPPS